LGIDLCIPIEKKSFANKTVYSVASGVLVACLEKSISRNDVDDLAKGIVGWHKELAPATETTCVFLDSAFADDVAKTNLATILNQHGISNVRSL
jgi:adenine-specific DNA-methyltransferase